VGSNETQFVADWRSNTSVGLISVLECVEMGYSANTLTMSTLLLSWRTSWMQDKRRGPVFRATFSSKGDKLPSPQCILTKLTSDENPPHHLEGVAYTHQKVVDPSEVVESPGRLSPKGTILDVSPSSEYHCDLSHNRSGQGSRTVLKQLGVGVNRVDVLSFPRSDRVRMPIWLPNHHVLVGLQKWSKATKDSCSNVLFDQCQIGSGPLRTPA